MLAALLAEVAPRLRSERERIWVDGRGLVPGELVAGLLRALAVVGVEDTRVGLAEVPVVAWAAARVDTAEGECGGVGVWETSEETGVAEGSADSDARSEGACPEHPHTPTPPHSHTGRVTLVPPGQERRFLAPLPLAVLDAEGADPRAVELLAGVGIETCGALAALEREAVEVRFGMEGVRLWRLARGDDPRLLFEAMVPERPRASLDFVEYVVTDPERLAFTVNALLGSICDGLRERGQHARRLLLTLELAGGGRWEQGLRAGRATASRAVWLRLARAALERTKLPDAVAGVRLQVEATEPAGIRQGDLFDAGFATAPAVEAAVMRLLESQGEVIVRPEADAHPLAERRVAWRPVRVDEVVSATAPEAQTLDGERGNALPQPRAHTAVWECGGVGVGEKAAPLTLQHSWAAGLPKGRRNRADAAVAHTPTPPHPHSGGDAGERPGAVMTLQLLKSPREIRVETELRRDHGAPARYRERGSGWHQVVSAAGPDRLSGGTWEGAYAREYFQVVTADGMLVWLFRDARRGTWYLHGWWD